MSEASRLRVGVIGDPIAHSISPAMQQPAFDALGINAAYERWQTTVAELPERLMSLRPAGVLGANVTVPHKQAVIELIDEVSQLAIEAGAVNTIVNRGGVLVGDNTDVYGFATSLTSAFQSVSDRAALILGAGGAARGVVLALKQLGVTSITVANRDVLRAERLANDLGGIQPIESDEETLNDSLPRIDLLINATSLGWRQGEIPIIPKLLDRLPARTLVVDLTYRDTDLLIEARSRGFQTLDGLPMLVHQGARAFELFTGQPAPVEIMMNAALGARDART